MRLYIVVASSHDSYLSYDKHPLYKNVINIEADLVVTSNSDDDPFARFDAADHDCRFSCWSIRSISLELRDRRNNMNDGSVLLFLVMVVSYDSSWCSGRK